MQTDSALARAKKLYADKAIDQNDYETAVANQQSAEGALKAAREAVGDLRTHRGQIDQIVATPPGRSRAHREESRDGADHRAQCRPRPAGAAGQRARALFRRRRVRHVDDRERPRDGQRSTSRLVSP